MYAKNFLVVACTLLGITAASSFGDVPGNSTGLNNIVFELLNVPSPSVEYNFDNPREGWIYICVPTPTPVPSSLPVAIVDGQQVALKRVRDQLEAMRYVSEGGHTIEIQGGPVESLEVRAIGELTYATYGADPMVTESGVYTWQYLRQNVLDSYNGIVGSGVQQAEIEEWTSEGKRWFSLGGLPPSGSTVQQAFDYWTQTDGMSHSLMNGIWADEFGVSLGASRYAVMNAAIDMIQADSQFDGRQFMAYCGSSRDPIGDYEVMLEFDQNMMHPGYRFAVEWYLPEGLSRPGRIIENADDLVQEFSPGWMMNIRNSFESRVPGSANNRVVVTGLLTQPEETMDNHPGYNYNVFMDAQLKFIATDPSFFGARGLQGYYSRYCGEEQTRLYADLLRHYAIEGQTDLMLEDPYVLTHLENPDFNDGTTGWTLAVADTSGAGSIQAKNAPGFGVLQGRFHAPPGLGDTVVWTKRNGSSANVISQQVQDLVVGKLYSLRFFTGDYQQYLSGSSSSSDHAMSVDLGGMDLVNELTFKARIHNNYSGAHWYGPFNNTNLYWMNYHQIVFRATAATTTLQLSDWSSPSSPGGSIGQELMWNYIQLQPYYVSPVVTTQGTVFKDNFDNVSDTAAPIAQVGSYQYNTSAVHADGTATSAPNVGLNRRTGAVNLPNNKNNLGGVFSSAGVTGELVHFEVQQKITSGPLEIGIMSEGAGAWDYGDPTEGIIKLNVTAGSITAYGTGGGTSTVLTTTYTPDVWELWQIDYVVGESSYTLTVGGQAPETVTELINTGSITSVGTFSLMCGHPDTDVVMDDILVTTIMLPTTCADVCDFGYSMDMDFNYDCSVNGKDVSQFASSWAQCNDPCGPNNCIATWPEPLVSARIFFEDDFDNVGEPNAPNAQVGSYQYNTSAVYADGGARSGPNVGLNRRETVLNPPKCNLGGVFASTAVTGELVHFELQQKITSGPLEFGIMSETAGAWDYWDSSKGIINLNVSLGNITAYGTGGATSTVLTTTYTPNVWQLWQIDYVVGAGSYTLTVGGQDPETVTEIINTGSVTSVGTFSLMGGNPDMDIVMDDILVRTIMPPATCAEALADGYGLAMDFTGPAGNPDCYVDARELELLVSKWLECNDPTGPINCIANWLE